MQHPAKYFHKRLNSTNLYASQIVKGNHEKEPFWVRTDDQYAGKGQGRHTWLSEPGLNLTGTLVIFPDHFDAARQFALSKVFALAAAVVLEIFTPDIRIKWPNDIYAGGRKIGGLLIETAIMGKTVDHAILGVGLNINQLTFPADLPNPVSLSLITGFSYDLAEMEDLFIESFLNQYRLIETEDFNEIDDQYVSRLFRFGELASYQAGNEIFTGTIIGVSEYGHLQLADEKGELRSFAYQEVEYIL